MRYKKLFQREREEDYTFVISKEQPLSYATENLKKAVLNLEFVNLDNKYKIIQFTSTLQSEGKTTVVTNFGHLLSTRNKKVIILDLDLRRPKLHRVSNVSNKNGLNDYLLGTLEKNDIIQTNKYLGFDFITTGTRTSVISNALNSDKLKNLLKELKETYDYVLIDTPPTYMLADSHFISKIVDGLVYVVGQNIAKKRHVRDSISELKKLNAPIIGMMLTQIELKKGEYYYYYEEKSEKK